MGAHLARRRRASLRGYRHDPPTDRSVAISGAACHVHAQHVSSISNLERRVSSASELVVEDEPGHLHAGEAISATRPSTPIDLVANPRCVDME